MSLHGNRLLCAVVGTIGPRDADAVLVRRDGIYVRRSIGSGFGPAEQWCLASISGERGVFFADVTGGT